MRSVPGARILRSKRRPSVERGGALGGGSRGQELAGHVVAAAVGCLLHVDRTRQPLPIFVAEEAEVGVEEAPDPLGIAQGDPLPHRAQVERRDLALRVGGPALELDRAAGERAREPLHLERGFVEAQGALRALEPVGEPAHAKAGAFEGRVGRRRLGSAVVPLTLTDRRALPEPRSRRLSAARARRSAVPRAEMASAPEPSTPASPAISRSVPSPARRRARRLKAPFASSRRTGSRLLTGYSGKTSDSSESAASPPSDRGERSGPRIPSSPRHDHAERRRQAREHGAQEGIEAGARALDAKVGGVG